MSNSGAVGAVDLVSATRRYRGGVRALDGVNLSLRSGEIGALVGPNGSGKSTALKLLAGLMPPTTGEARIEGIAAETAAARARIGYLPESPHFPAWLTVREFLRYVGQLSGLSGTSLDGAIIHRLAWAGLSQLANRRADQLSTGQRQRLGLVQALLHQPIVMLLDEPAAGLDPVGVTGLAHLLAQLRAEGRTVLLSSHFLPQVETVCDRIWLLGEGRVLWSGTAGESGSLERRYIEAFAHVATS